MEPQKYQPEDQIVNFSLEMTVKCMNDLSISPFTLNQMIWLASMVFSINIYWNILYLRKIKMSWQILCETQLLYSNIQRDRQSKGFFWNLLTV